GAVAGRVELEQKLVVRECPPQLADARDLGCAEHRVRREAPLQLLAQRSAPIAERLNLGTLRLARVVAEVGLGACDLEPQLSVARQEIAVSVRAARAACRQQIGERAGARALRVGERLSHISLGLPANEALDQPLVLVLPAA